MGGICGAALSAVSCANTGTPSASMASANIVNLLTFFILSSSFEVIRLF